MPDVTLQDVADSVGVTVSTVSRALSSDRSSLVNAETRARIIEAAAELGYRGNSQASALRRGRSGTVGVIVADLSNPYIGPTLQGVSSAVLTRGLLPFVAESGDSSDRLKEICSKLLAQRVEGIITTAARYGDKGMLRSVAREVPLVLAVRKIPESGLTTIAHDDEMGGEMAARHLLDLGHNDVAELVGPQDIYSFEARSRGFGRVMAKAGANCVSVPGDDTLPNSAAGYDLMTELVAQRGDNLPTAIFAHNDTMAVGAITKLRELGLGCPDDVSVIGYNDVPLAGYVAPALTTVRLPGYELGRMSAELLVAAIEGGLERSNAVTLSPELVIRSSTRAPGPGGSATGPGKKEAPLAP